MERRATAPGLYRMENLMLSQRQLELQARISQRRIGEIKRVLESGVQAPVPGGIDSDLVEVIRRLYDTSLSEADIASCILILETSIETDALAPLVDVMKSDSYNMSLRRKAAHAISVIGSEYVQRDISELASSTSAELNLLAKIACGLGTEPESTSNPSFFFDGRG